MIIYLNALEILSMHYILIKRFGGSEGLRDFGALDSALHRPQSGYYDDILQQASALWESLTNNHPFVDGNKRIGFAATDTFLRVNGYKITASPKNTWKFINGSIESHTFEYDKLENWLRENTEKV